MHFILSSIVFSINKEFYEKESNRLQYKELLDNNNLL
jgi:hypothetical protein